MQQDVEMSKTYKIILDGSTNPNFHKVNVEEFQVTTLTQNKCRDVTNS